MRLIIFFVVLDCDKPALDGLENIMKPLSTLLSTAISRSQRYQEKADNLTWVQSKSTIYCGMPPPPLVIFC